MLDIMFNNCTFDYANVMRSQINILGSLRGMVVNETNTIGSTLAGSIDQYKAKMSSIIDQMLLLD